MQCVLQVVVVVTVESAQKTVNAKFFCNDLKCDRDINEFNDIETRTLNC